MAKKMLIRSILVAVILFLVREGIAVIARLFYQHPAGRMTSFIQNHNRMVSDYADWVFSFIVAGVWVFLYLRNRRPGYRRLVVQIASVLGIFSLISIVQGIVKILLSKQLPGTPAANIVWIVMTIPLWFIKTAVLTGLMAAAVIAVINRWRPLAQKTGEEGVAPFAAAIVPETPGETSAVPSPGEKVHPLVSGVIVGGSAGCLFGAAFVLIPRIIGRGMEVVMLALLPVGLMYQEFMSFDPFIPETFRGYEKAYPDVMALMVLTSLGIIVASVAAFQEARSCKPVPLGRLLGIGICVGASIGVVRVVALLVLAPRHTAGIFATPIAWATGAILLALVIAGMKQVIRFRGTLSLAPPLTGPRLIAVFPGLLVVSAMVMGQAMDVRERRDLNEFSKKSEKERQQRDSCEGLRIDHYEARWDASGDLVISGSVSNTTDINKAWFFLAETYDSGGKVLTSAKMLDGRQLFSMKETELLTAERNLPQCLVLTVERQLSPKSTSLRIPLKSAT